MLITVGCQQTNLTQVSSKWILLVVRNQIGNAGAESLWKHPERMYKA